MEFLNLNLNRKRVKDIGISCQTYLSFNVRRSLRIPGAVVDLSSNRTSLASDLLANQIIEMNIRISMTTFDKLPRYLQLKTTISQIISECFTRENDNNFDVDEFVNRKFVSRLQTVWRITLACA